MYTENEGPIDGLVHLYVDGAFSRRELIQRVAAHTGSVAAAITVLAGYSLLNAQSISTCNTDASVPADAPDLNVADVEFPGEAGSILGYLASPKTISGQLPAVIVIHENRGLVDHIKDVTRRVARAGYVGLGVDLLSRQGGTQQFTDPVQQMQAYARTNPDERYADLVAGLTYLKFLEYVQYDHIATVGFCAGGGNAWNLAVNLPELRAVVVFYGTPIPPADQLMQINSPVLATYRLEHTPSERLARTLSAWSISSGASIAIFSALGGLLADATGPRTALAVAGLLILASPLLLPRRRDADPLPARSPAFNAESLVRTE